MLLEKYHGDQYKSIENSGELLVHPRITRLVGQNEAGKSALLELLNTLKPVGPGSPVFALEDYPRKTFSRYKRTHDSNPHSPVRATFRISENEIETIDKKFGPRVLKSELITLSKKYANDALYFNLTIDEVAFIKNFISKLDLEDHLKDALRTAKTIADLKVEIGKLSPERQVIAKSLPEDLTVAVYKTLRVPYFFYFDEYATLPGEISLKRLKEFVNSENYKGADGDSLRTAKALIDVAGVEVDDFLNKENYERLKADLEAASNEITDQLRKFWTSNKNLEIDFDLQPVLDSSDKLIDTLLHVRVKNTKHRVTVPFGKRSKGFVWFFSFLVAFTEYRERDEEIILLLDEPGLNLGARAQRDLMKYFEEELAPHHQIIYTTHSPFMIDPKQLDTVRTVEDDEEFGTQVSNDPYKHTSDTVFPLQAALGYDLTQTLFVAPNNLLVEGPSDLIYINLASEVLRSEGRSVLSEEWTPVPVGGADKIASFISLLGAQGLNIAVFMDASKNDEQLIQGIMRNKLMLKKHLITVGSVLEKPSADIEDLFSVGAYLKLVSRSYSKELGGAAISENDFTETSPRIVKRLEVYFNERRINKGHFSHYKPAYDLMLNPQWIKDVFDADTKNNFEKAFLKLNTVLGDEPDQNQAQSLPVKHLKSLRNRDSEKDREADL